MPLSMKQIYKKIIVYEPYFYICVYRVYSEVFNFWFSHPTTFSSLPIYPLKCYLMIYCMHLLNNKCIIWGGGGGAVSSRIAVENP